MPVSRRTRVAAAAAVVAIVPMLASCSSVGFEAPTGKVYIPAVGANDRSGSVDVLNALVVSGQDGTGTLIATFVDNDATTADALEGVTGADLAVASTTGVLPAAIPANRHLSLADLAPVAVTGARVMAGNFVTLTFTFSTAESITITVPVVGNEGDFADIELPSTTDPSPSPTEATE